MNDFLNSINEDTDMSELLNDMRGIYSDVNFSASERFAFIHSILDRLLDIGMFYVFYGLCIDKNHDDYAQREIISIIEDKRHSIESKPDQGKKKKVVLDNGEFRPVAKNDYNLKSAKDVMEKEPEWLIMGYIPKYGMTSLAGEGGTGKTSVVCSIVASVTTGSRSFLEGNPFNDKYEPGKVIIFSAEDSWEYVLKKRLISCGADLDKVLYMGPEDERFVNINFNSEFLGGLIEHHKPDLVIFDPVQAFVPENFRMGDRNAMRKCFSPLIGYGEKYGTTFIIVVHANKQSGVWGRKRMADSSDIWDASRSVLMLGNVPNSELRYISHEKSNWGAKQQSVIFELNECVPEFKNHTTKKDKDFVLEESKIKQNNTSSCDLAKDFIISTLCEHKQMEVKELDELAKASGISTHALKDAKAELNKEKQVHTWSIGYGKDKKYYITLKDTENTDE